jgi:hypothetical protein
MYFTYIVHIRYYSVLLCCVRIYFILLTCSKNKWLELIQGYSTVCGKELSINKAGKCNMIVYFLVFIFVLLYGFQIFEPFSKMSLLDTSTLEIPKALILLQN